MPPKMLIQLPTPWHITYHEFYDEPGESEDLFQAELQVGADILLLDAGWYVDHYRAVLVKNYDWQNFLHVFRTTDRYEVVAWLQNMSQTTVKD